MLLEPSHPVLSIREQCRILEINRSSIYYKPIEHNKFEDGKLKLLNLVDETYTRYPFMGIRMMWDCFHLQGHIANQTPPYVLGL